MGPGGIRGVVLTLVLGGAASVLAHKHPADDAENIAKPIDAILYLHIVIQVMAWGFVFPIGMVFGLVRWAYYLFRNQACNPNP